MSIARDTIIARCQATDFSSMSSSAYWDWIDRLPRDEFLALMALNDEYARHGTIKPARRKVAPPPLEPNDDSWVVYTGNGELPVAAHVLCWVLYPDGSADGPNRADAFFWWTDGKEKVVAYALETAHA